MPKSERLLNLLILLLVQQQFLSKARIRELMPPYQSASDEAFDRQFERDKDELRAMGVPIETGTHSAYFDDEPGYRIKKDEFELTGIDLTADEAAVVGLATRVWQHAGLAAHTSDAITKLAAAGIEVDRSRLDLGVPAVRVDDPSFDDFWTASLSQTRVRFDYRRSGGEQSTRRLEPWGLVSYSGRWYVVGHDLDRGEERVFRLSRVTGPVKRLGRGHAFTVPEGTDLRGVVERLAPPPPTASATVLVRTGTCLGLRRRAVQIDTEDTTGPARPGWDRLRISYASEDDLADEILWWGADVEVETPESVRALVVRRLRMALASAGQLGEETQ